MLSVTNKIRRFLVSEDGPTAVEYAVMLALIVIVCLAAIGSIGTNAKTTFTNVANSLGSRQLAFARLCCLLFLSPSPGACNPWAWSV